MKVILLAGYRTPQENEKPVGLEVDASGMTVLDSHVQRWAKLGWEVVVVLAGSQADEQLRLCRELAQTEFAFDTTPKPNLITNVSAGMYTTEEACLIFPVEMPFPDAGLCSFLKNESAKAGFRTPYTFLQATNAQGAPCHMGFPLLVTRKGNELIRSLNDLTSLNDPRLTYLQVALSEAPTLASSGQSL